MNINEMILAFVKHDRPYVNTVDILDYGVPMVVSAKHGVYSETLIIQVWEVMAFHFARVDTRILEINE